MPTLPADKLAVVATSTTTPRPTTPASTPHRGPHRGHRVRRRRGQRRRALVGIRKDADGRVRRRHGRRADGQRHHGRAARPSSTPAGVWADDVRTLDEGSRPRLDPSGQGHPHHRARGARSATTSPWSSRCPRTSAPSSWCRGAISPTSAPPTPTTTGPSTTRSAPARTSTTCCDAINVHRASPTSDVVGTWAGLRPLVKSARQRPHRRPVPAPQGARASPSGVVTVTGGKLTTYREMAADTVDEVVERPRAPASRASPAVAAPRSSASAAPRATTRSSADDRRRTVAAPRQPLRRRGPHRAGPGRGRSRRSREPLVAGLPYLRAEAVYAARHEMARSVDDVLSRRTRARLLARDASAAAADDVAALIAPAAGSVRRRGRRPGVGLPCGHRDRTHPRGAPRDRPRRQPRRLSTEPRADGYRPGMRNVTVAAVQMSMADDRRRQRRHGRGADPRRRRRRVRRSC